MRSAIRSSRSTPGTRPSAIAMRRSEPNWLMSTLWPAWPFTFSNSSAGPPGAYFSFVALCGPLACDPILHTRSVISVISSSGETSSRMRLQLAVLFEGFDPVAQIVVGQGRAPGRRRVYSTMVSQSPQRSEHSERRSKKRGSGARLQKWILTHGWALTLQPRAVVRCSR